MVQDVRNIGKNAVKTSPMYLIRGDWCGVSVRGDEKEILPGILSESEVLKEKMTSEPSSGECSVCGKEGAGL